MALLAQGRPQEAEEAFRGALQMAEPMDAEWASNNLAVALKAQGSERYGALGKLRRVWGMEKKNKVLRCLCVYYIICKSYIYIYILKHIMYIICIYYMDIYIDNIYTYIYAHYSITYF